jgi:DNA-nicking Smr family endonuclease
MKPPKREGFHQPFKALGSLFRAPPARRETAPPAVSEPAPSPAVDEQALFFDAVSGVHPLCWNGVEPDAPKPVPAATAPVDGAEEIEDLRRLIENGQGFTVADTPEYMEGVGCPAPPGITRRLHRGDFSVQAHLDLHGFSAAGAQEVFDAFMREAVATGKRAVLIVHGRGLSSPAGPVLKARVAEWLTTGPWRKWVVAFASARRCDGGCGASYVLLRRRPVPKRCRRRLRANGHAAATPKNYY